MARVLDFEMFRIGSFYTCNGPEPSSGCVLASAGSLEATGLEIVFIGETSAGKPGASGFGLSGICGAGAAGCCGSPGGCGEATATSVSPAEV